MTDKPILFSAPMVAAILEGRKTQTRCILDPQPKFDPGGVICDGAGVLLAIYPDSPRKAAGMLEEAIVPAVLERLTNLSKKSKS